MGRPLLTLAHRAFGTPVQFEVSIDIFLEWFNLIYSKNIPTNDLEKQKIDLLKYIGATPKRQRAVKDRCQYWVIGSANEIAHSE